MADGVTYHWVRIEDSDLAYILDGPGDDFAEWIDEVLDIVEDGLETA